MLISLVDKWQENNIAGRILADSPEKAGYSNIYFKKNCPKQIILKGGDIMKKRFLYGPILSRRLGRSLGVDIVPYKTCSLDCIYCECGSTTNLTMERKEYFPTVEIIQDLKNFLDTRPELDYITFAGSGEPTLHNGLGEIITFLKRSFPQYKVAVLTNATLLNDSQVIEDLKMADLVVPSIDGVSGKVFRSMNRPHQELTPEKVINGIKKLKEGFTGEIWLEIFIAPGINDNEQELYLFRDIIQELGISKVQLNSLDRPGAVDWIKPLEKSRLKQIASTLGPVEIV